MIGKLNHIGIAVPDLDQAIGQYCFLFDLDLTKITAPKILEDMGVRLVFIQLDHAEIELIEPYGNASPLLKFMEKNRYGGQHHLCYEVDDLRYERDKLIKKGAKFAGSKTPRIGAHGKPVLFIHPKSANGILIELMQS